MFTKSIQSIENLVSIILLNHFEFLSKLSAPFNNFGAIFLKMVQLVQFLLPGAFLQSILIIINNS